MTCNFENLIQELPDGKFTLVIVLQKYQFLNFQIVSFFFAKKATENYSKF